MLSYCWGYTIGDIVDTLVDYCETQKIDTKRAYIWICCLCNNQHRVAEMNQNGTPVEFEEFQDIFYSRVTGIQHILAMMDPWEKPFYLTRVWCIFELYTANSNEDCMVSVVMPPKEKQRLVEALTKDDGLELLFKTFDQTKVQNAQASQAEDKERILSMIAKNPGYDALNIAVNGFLRKWVLAQILEAAEFYDANRNLSTETDLILFFNNIGMILSRNGDTDSAMKLYRLALEIEETQDVQNVPSIAKKYINIAENLREKGLYNESLEKVLKAVSMLENFNNGESQDLLIAYNNAGLVLTAKGDYNDSMKYYEAAIKRQLKSNGETHADTAVMYSNIGLLCAKQGKYETALSFYQKSVDIYEAVGASNLPVATVRNNIGLTYLDQANYEGALIEFEKALNLYLKLIGTQNDTLVVYNNIALAYKKMGKLNKAAEEYEKAIAFIENQFGQENGTIPILLNNYGELKMEMNEIDDALKYLQMAEESYKNTFGPNNPECATPINNMAAVMAKKGEALEAIKLQEKALKIFQKAHGEVHETVGTSYGNLGNFYLSLEKLDEGMAYLEKSRIIFEKLVGKTHPLFARALNNIASVYESKGDLENALINYKAAAEIYEESMGDGQFETVKVLINLYQLQYRLGDYTSALTTMEKAKKLLLKGDMPDKEDMIVKMNFEIAAILNELKKYEEAVNAYEGLWRDSIFLSKDSTMEATAYFALGSAYQSMNDYTSALKSFQQAFEMRKRILGTGNIDTAIASNNLGLMMYNLGDYPGALTQHKFTISLHESNDRHVDVALSYYNCGLALFELGNVEESLSFMQKAYDIWNENFGPEHENTKMVAASTFAIMMARSSSK